MQGERMAVQHRVWITGASGALGQAVVKQFASEGWEVLATHHSGPVPLEHPRVDWVCLDVSDPKAIETVVGARLRERPVDALMHCAGGFRYGDLATMSWEDVDFLWTSNLRSALASARAVLPGMLARRSGHLVFVGAAGAMRPSPHMSAYAAMKAGLHALVTSLSEETKDRGVGVNAVLPYTIDTPANRAAMPKADFSTWVAPETMAKLMWRLTTPELATLRGALIPVSASV